MIRSESDMWQTLRGAMGAFWRPQRIESRSTGNGTPDTHFVIRGGGYEAAWLEMKVTGALEKDRPNKISHFYKAQEQWLLEHWRLGVPTFFALYVKSTGEWLWFKGEEIGMVQNQTGDDIRKAASYRGLMPDLLNYLKTNTFRHR